MNEIASVVFCGIFIKSTKQFLKHSVHFKGY